MHDSEDVAWISAFSSVVALRRFFHWLGNMEHMLTSRLFLCIMLYHDFWIELVWATFLECAKLWIKQLHDAVREAMILQKNKDVIRWKFVLDARIVFSSWIQLLATPVLLLAGLRLQPDTCLRRSALEVCRNRRLVRFHGILALAEDGQSKHSCTMDKHPLNFWARHTCSAQVAKVTLVLPKLESGYDISGNEINNPSWQSHWAGRASKKYCKRNMCRCCNLTFLGLLDSLERHFLFTAEIACPHHSCLQILL